MPVLFLIGRIILGGYFIYSGYNHFAHLGNLTGYAQSKGIPMAKAGVIVSGITMLLGGLSVLLGFMPQVGLWILIATMLVMTLTMHRFWSATDPMQKMSEMINFNKNFALMGAMLMIIALAIPWMMTV